MKRENWKLFVFMTPALLNSFSDKAGSSWQEYGQW
jgi:hypothetical protein